MDENTQIICSLNRSRSSFFGDLQCAENRQTQTAIEPHPGQTSASGHSPLYSASTPNTLPVADWGECIICGGCSDVGHAWWCIRNPAGKHCSPKWGSK